MSNPTNQFTEYWTLEDQNFADSSEGWFVSAAARPGFIYAKQNEPMFTTHEEALAYVERRAAEGSDLHQRALAYVMHMKLTGVTGR